VTETLALRDHQCTECGVKKEKLILLLDESETDTDIGDTAWVRFLTK